MAALIHTLGDLGRAVARLDQDISALRTEGGRDSLSESLHTVQQCRSALNTELELLYYEISIRCPLSPCSFDSLDAGVPCARISAGPGSQR